MKRREFITLVGGAAAAWPLAARGQERKRMRHIGVLVPATGNDPDFQAWIGAFQQGLAQFGWIIGRSVRIDTRWAGSRADDIRKEAAELAASTPDVILAHGASTVGPLLQATRTVPIVFPVLGDPVAAGYVESLARPGGNATGFMTIEYSMSAKWLELLREMAPSVNRVAVLRDPTQGSGTSEFAVIQAIAPSLHVEVSPVNVRDGGEIERAIATFARSASGGLIVTTSGAASVHRALIIEVAARYRLPTVYYARLSLPQIKSGYIDDAIHQGRAVVGCVRPCAPHVELARLSPAIGGIEQSCSN